MKKIIKISVVIFILIIITLFIIRGDDGVNYDEFAKCLTEKGVVLYGVYWCHYCQLQKKDFGDSFKFVDYVECSKDRDKCIEKDIQSFPTWIIDGVKYPGKQSLSRLSALTKCELGEV
jgi:hypothetical protein